MITYLVRSDGRRLCQDNLWREHAPFGSMGNCIKPYRQPGRAQRKAAHLTAIEEYRARQNNEKPLIVKAFTLPSGHSMDAAGSIFGPDDSMLRQNGKPVMAYDYATMETT